MRNKVRRQLFKKELLDVLRDRKAMLMLVLVPLLIYPLIFFGSFAVMSMIQTNMEQREYKVVLDVDDDGALESEITEYNLKNVESKSEDSEKSSQSDASARTIDRLSLVAFDGEKTEEAVNKALQEEKIDVYVKSEKDDNGRITYRIKYISSITNSSYAEGIVEKLLGTMTQKQMEGAIEAAGLDVENVVHPFDMKRNDIATKEQSAGSLLGTVLPFMLIISLLMGTMYPAIDTTAGEKERGTLETLLTLPVRNHDIIIAKFLTVALVGIASALLNIISMGIMIFYMVKLISSSEMSGLGLDMSDFKLGSFALPMLVTVLAVFAFSLFISAVTMCITALAKSYKEANNYITPLTLVVMLTGYIGFIPNIELTEKMALVPVANICLLIKNLLMFKAQMGTIAIVLISNVIYANLAILFLGKIYNSENVLFDEGRGNIQIFQKRKNMQKGGVPTIGDTWFILCFTFILYLYVGSIIQMKYKIGGIFGSQLLIFIIPLLYALYTKKDLKKTFSLRLCKVSQLGAGIMLFLGTFLVENTVSTILYNFFPEEFSDTSSGLMQLLTGGGVIVTYLVVAFTPAICEELFFRGFVFAGFKSRYRAATAIVLSAVMFGAYHTSLVRFLPTTILGIAFAYMLYFSGSLIPSMICHCANNALYVFEMYHPGILEKKLPILFASDQGSIQMAIIFMVGLVMIIAGGWILRNGKNKKN